MSIPLRHPAEQKAVSAAPAAHEFEIPILDRKEIPLRLRLVLEHDFQRRAKLGDRRLRPRRPVGEPSLQRAARLPGLLTLERASPPPEVGDRAEDRAITDPGARGVAALLSPARLEEGQRDQAPVDKPVVLGISGRVRGVGLFRPLLKQLERLAILPGPLPQRRIR